MGSLAGLTFVEPGTVNSHDAELGVVYDAVTPHPTGTSTVARFALTAADQGYDGIVVRTPTDCEDGYDASAIAERYGLDVVEGNEILADDRAEATTAVQSLREATTVLCLRGGSLNRFAVEDPRVDVLIRPMADGDVNHVLAKAAARNGVRLEFAFDRVLRADGGRRVQALRELRKLREMVEQYDTPYVVSAGAESHLQLRAPRELLALGDLLGFTPEQVEHGLREWGRIADRNREVQSDSFIEPGVRRGRYEEDHR